MKISVLASGSKGNSTYIEGNNAKILIDLGMTNSYIEDKLNSIGVDPDSINAIFITHTHTDHIAGIKVFIKKHNPVVYLTKEMYLELKDIVKDYVILEDKVTISDLTINYFKTSHDTSSSVGYIITSTNTSFVYVTDTGYINVKNFPELTNKNMYVFESNHDVSMLMNNERYPYQTKMRILGDEGHLSNVQSSDYLKRLVGDNTKYIILAHLSEQNNSPELAFNTLKNKLNNENVNIMIASQNERTELVEV